MPGEIALIVGAGKGLSASLARLFHSEGMKVILAARNIEKLKTIASETKATLFKCDGSDIDQVENMFKQIDELHDHIDLVVYNPSDRVPGFITEIDPVAAKKAIEITSFGAFLVARQAAKRMTQAGKGTILFTGATAGVKGFPLSSTFAMGKFALRGLAQALARELHPLNIHVGHFVIDGRILTLKRWEEIGGTKDNLEDTEQLLHPDEIAKIYLQFHRHHKSTWSWEIELRPKDEGF
jgi:short-subunit dehydrogenase